MSQGFEGLMLDNVWNGLKLKKEKQLRNLPLNVRRLDGGVEKVIFQDVMEFKYPNEYSLVGTCLINNEEHTFEYVAKHGIANSSVIGFLPQKKSQSEVHSYEL